MKSDDDPKPIVHYPESMRKNIAVKTKRIQYPKAEALKSDNGERLKTLKPEKYFWEGTPQKIDPTKSA